MEPHEDLLSHGHSKYYNFKSSYMNDNINYALHKKIFVDARPILPNSDKFCDKYRDKLKFIVNILYNISIGKISTTGTYNIRFLLHRIVINEDYQMMKFVDENILDPREAIDKYKPFWISKYGDILYYSMEVYNDESISVSKYDIFTRMKILWILLKYANGVAVIDIVNTLYNLYRNIISDFSENEIINTMPKYTITQHIYILLALSSDLLKYFKTDIYKFNNIVKIIDLIMTKNIPHFDTTLYSNVEWTGTRAIKLIHNEKLKKIKDMYPRNDKFANELKNKWHHIKYKPDNLWFNHKIKGMEPVYPIEYYE